MSETLTQKHLDLLNLIATSPPPIDSSQMVTKLRRPSLEDLLLSPATATKASNRNSMSGIYVRSRPTSFSEFDMAFDPDYDYADLLARPISQTAIKETLASLGLRLQQGQSLFMQLSQLQGQIQQDESTSTSSAAVVAPTAGRPPKPTRPLPTPDGPPPGYVTIMSSRDVYESDGEEIVYMLEDYKSRHQCMVVDAKDPAPAPDLPLPATPKCPTTPKEEGKGQALVLPANIEAINVDNSEAIVQRHTETTEVSTANTTTAFEEPQKAEYVTSRANKRMGVLGIQATPIKIDIPTVNALSIGADGAETNSRPTTRTRASSKSVTFAPDTVIKREPKRSLSKAGGSKAGEKKSPVEATRSQVGEAGSVTPTAVNAQDQIPTPTVEVFEVNFAELEGTTASAITDSAPGKKVKKKHHFGVYKVIRNVLKRSSGEQKADKPTATIVEEPIRSKTPTPSIATTVGGRPNVLRKPDPAAKLKSSAASVYSVNLAAETGSQKTKKSFRAWSIRSGKGGRKGTTDPVQFPPKESAATGTGLLAPSATHQIGVRRRSASFSGFATIAAPAWDDPVDMDQLIKDAAERLKQNPKREWVYKPKADPILEQGENPIDVGFVLERHVAV